MRIALAPTVATPAQTWMEQASWLLQPGSGVLSMHQVDELTVRLIVADPLSGDMERSEREEADRLIADSARTVLEQALHGVRLLPTTTRGYVGRIRELAPAQLTFTATIPGVQRYDLAPHDVDGDGLVAPDEYAHLIEVDGPDDVRRIDWLLRDRFDEGSVQDGPVQIVVPRQPFRPALSPGAAATAP